MNFEPQKFFIGLMDFFTILLPGAFLTYPLMGELGPIVLGSGYYRLSDTGGWAAFLFASYLFGHIIFLIGSWLDEFYDWTRRYTLNAQIARLAHRDILMPKVFRRLHWLVFKDERDLAVRRAVMLKEQAVARLQAKDAVNAFQWCKAWLNVESPASLSIVERLEADSKFFRSLSVVLVALLILSTRRSHSDWPLWVVVPVTLVLICFALWRYMEQRFKATNQAYTAVITLIARIDKVSLIRTEVLAADVTHVGGVVYRWASSKKAPNQVEYLLIQTTDDAHRWILPNGRREEREDRRETAVRKVYEESGVWAYIRERVGQMPYPIGTSPLTEFYLMEMGSSGP